MVDREPIGGDLPDSFESHAGPAGWAGDIRLFCKRCCRDEFHYLAVKDRGRYAYRLWRSWTFGLIDLVGRFRCRCCGNRRFWRFDWRRGSLAPSKVRTRTTADTR